MVVSFSSIKGGTGKTSLCIHTANYCVAAGYSVLVVDFDIQNSLSFYFLDQLIAADEKNLALALTTRNLAGNILPSNTDGIDIVASSFALTGLRTVGSNTLRRMLAESDLRYDFILIDCPPTYDNLVQNAVVASDLILTPVKLSQFDFKGAMFYRDLLAQDTDRLPAWRVVFNFYRPPRTDNPDTLRNQYETLFRDAFEGAILPFQIPETTLLQRSVDARERMTEVASKANLFRAIQDLAVTIGVERSPARY